MYSRIAFIFSYFIFFLALPLLKALSTKSFEIFLRHCTKRVPRAKLRTSRLLLPVTHKDAVGWCEGVVYLTSPGRPADLGLQLGSPAILVAGKGRGGMFLFLLFFFFFFFHFLSCSSFFPVPLFYYVFSLFSPFL